MKVGLSYITQIRKADDPETKAGFIAQTFNQLTAAVATGYHTEHHDDDTHAAIHCDTISASAQPRCIAYHSATQSLTSATYTALNLDSEDFDVGNMHDPVTNNTRFTIPVGGGGVYQIVGRTSWAPGAGNLRLLAIYKNGAEINDTTVVPIGGGIQTQQLVTTFAPLLAGDVLELYGYQDSGGALNAGSATRIYASTLQAVKYW